MTKTKSSLLLSAISLLLCVSMLIGTTFAWFTDSVTSSGNKIESGTLKVDLELLDKENGEWISLKNANTKLFDYDKWEPGYTEIKILRVQNEGTLALKWVAQFVSDAELSKLADVIDVYVTTETLNAYPTDRDVVKNWTKAGTVAEFVNTIATTTKGTLLANDGVTGSGPDEAYLGIALKMREEANNDYQHLDLGGEFDIRIFATQLNSEKDSIDENYDEESKYYVPVSNLVEFFNAIENGYDMELSTTLVIDESFVNYVNERYPAATFALTSDTTVIDYNAVIDGGGITVSRSEKMKDKPLVKVTNGYTLTLSNITLDGGAVWSGEVDPVLLRGTENSGITTSGAIIETEANAHIVLGEGAVIQNNDGANAINIGTKAGSTLTINGGEIINNHSAAGAIWGGGAITLNSGKVNGNHGGIGGAIRIVTNVGTVLTMNGGEMNHNLSDGNGGAIWAGGSQSNNVYVLNGGEMAYNYSLAAGGAIYAGYYETVKIGGDFKMHNNAAASGGNAIRFHNHASFVMTGGEIYDNGENSLFLLNNTATITGGRISESFGYGGGLGLTIGKADIEGVISYDLSTNHNTAYLAAEFNGFEFTVNEEDEHFGYFNFKPAAEYTYTEGDEGKLVCLNEGYETYWDTTTSTFRLRATNIYQ